MLNSGRTSTLRAPLAAPSKSCLKSGLLTISSRSRRIVRSTSSRAVLRSGGDELGLRSVAIGTAKADGANRVASSGTERPTTLLAVRNWPSTCGSR